VLLEQVEVYRTWGKTSAPLTAIEDCVEDTDDIVAFLSEMLTAFFFGAVRGEYFYPFKVMPLVLVPTYKKGVNLAGFFVVSHRLSNGAIVRIAHINNKYYSDYKKIHELISLKADTEVGEYILYEYKEIFWSRRLELINVCALDVTGAALKVFHEKMSH